MQTLGRNIIRWFVIAAIGAAVGSSLITPRIGSTQPPPTTAPALEEAPISALEALTNPQEEVREKRTKAYIGLMALVGIIILGMATAAVIILWAGRLRRINRDPPARTVIKNDLWFLQPSRPGNDLPNRNPPHDSGTSATAENE